MLKEFRPVSAPLIGVAAPCVWAPLATSDVDAPVKGAPRPTGFSKVHTSPQPHTVRVHVGGSLLELKRPRGVGNTWEGQEPPERSEITEFSRRSRQRLRMDLAKVDQEKAGKAIFAGLTYPEAFPTSAEIFKGHLDAFGKRFTRAFPHAAFHWKLEFQKRDAPHFHPIFWNLSTEGCDVRKFRTWLARTWFEVVGSNDPKHLAAGTSADVIRSQFGIMRYVGPYVSDSDQSRPGWKVGRYWGVVGRANIPYAVAPEVEISPRASLQVWRLARRYQRAINRQRRLRLFLHGGFPVGDFFDGRGRAWRKSTPHLKVWQSMPRKITLKANDNINLFCDARQWARALERMVLA